MSEKIILSSDAHWGEKKYDELTQAKFVGETEEVPPAVLLDKIFDRYRQGNERRFNLLLKEVQKIEGVEHLFFCGDMVSGYGERGLSGKNSQEAINEFKKVLDNFICPEISKSYVAGGHELGYRLPWSWDKDGGINDKSIEMFEGNFNQLFYTFQKEQYNFVILSSDLELISNSDDYLTDKIRQKKQQQTEFYKDTINELERDERVILMLHDPDALNPMFDFLKEHLSKIEKTFVGHHHAQWTTAINQYLYALADSTFANKGMNFLENLGAKSSFDHLKSQKANAKIWKQVKLITIPAPGGNFGLGGGFLVGQLGENGLDVQKHKLPVDFGLMTGK